MQSKLKPIQLAILASLIPTTCFADSSTTELTPIIISADFRAADLQETTSSVTVITPVEIQKRSAQHLENAINLAPNVNSASGASRAHYFQIRGIGERSQFETPINPSVGLTIDGIDYSRSGAAGTLFDVEQVEVLRGPQGTRFGASAMAGMINLQSNEPTNETESHIKYTMGNYNTQTAGVAVGGALIKDKLLGRVSIHKHLSDGYIENSHLNFDDTQNQDELTAKAHLKWLATQDLTIDLKALHFNIDNGYDAFNFDNNYTTKSDEPGKDTLKSDALALKATWDINSQVRMETNLTHSNSDIEYSYDGDWSYIGEFASGLGPYQYFDQYLRQRKNNSIDLRFLSGEQGKIFNNSTDWVVGLYQINQDEDLNRTEIYDGFTSHYKSSFQTQNTALYGQLDHHLTSKLTLTTGLRVEQYESDFSDSEGIANGNSESLYGGKIGFSYQINPQQISYAHVSRGYKTGGINNNQKLPNNLQTFETEQLWNIETGLNSTIFDNKLKTRIALFYAQRENPQISSSLQLPSGDFIGYTANVDTGYNYGLEAELDWAINSKWRLISSLGLLNTGLTAHQYTDKYSGITYYMEEGRDQAHAPNYQYSIGGEFSFAANWTASANIEGKDEFYFSDSHNAKSSAYNLLNASLEYMRRDWTVTLWSRNLMDTEYDVRGFHFGNDPTTWVPATYTQKGAPRTVGLTVAWDY